MRKETKGMVSFQNDPGENNLSGESHFEASRFVTPYMPFPADSGLQNENARRNIQHA